jgi:hypothetical protein
MTVFLDSAGVTCHECAPQRPNINQHFNLYVMRGACDVMSTKLSQRWESGE